jgi:hypothetical protein
MRLRRHSQEHAHEALRAFSIRFWVFVHSNTMPVIHFIGKVFPRTLKLTIKNPRPFNCKIPDTDLTMSARVEIVDSVVDVICDVNKYSDADVVQLHKQAIYITRNLVNLVAFKRAQGIAVFFDGLIDPNGELCGLSFYDGRLEPLCSAYGIDEIDQFFEAAMLEPGLSVALDDLIQAISVPYILPINCARAIEALRHLFAQPGEERSTTWGRMRDHLQISDPYIRLITSHSTAPRHGDVSGVSGAVTAEISIRAWTIMNRFLIYWRRGKQPLSASEFPLL